MQSVCVCLGGGCSMVRLKSTEYKDFRVMWTETFINSHTNLYLNHIFLIQISTVTLVVVFTHNILGVSKCWVASITYLCFHKYVILMKASHTCIASDFLQPLSYIGCCYFLCPEVRKQFESYSLFHHLAMQNFLNLFICLYLKCIQFEYFSPVQDLVLQYLT